MNESKFINQIEPNFEMSMGEEEQSLIFSFTVKYNLINRLKYWLFCKFFPFKIVRWERKGDK